jgi:eukaryotic-like serine/threonine-protein kinase
MGVVYKGWDPSISREVAIKGFNKFALSDQEREGVVNRFRHEAQAVGRLVHPRIVQIYDFIENDLAAYIIMELVHGKTLAQHLASHDHFGLREIGQIVTQTLDGIGYAHSQGVVHRDMKTANIMINNDGRIKISDFGIARIDSSTLTQVGDLIGTPSYMSPEQFTSSEVGKTTDLYSIGVIAYELLTNHKPFVGTLPVIMQQVVNTPPAKPSSLNDKLSPEIDQVLAKAMAKNPEERYQTANEFSEAFKAAITATIQLTEPQTAMSPDTARLMEAARGLKIGATAGGNANIDAESFGDSPIVLDPGVKKARLLIVDDEERILNALKSLFRHRYHVFTTTDGNKALDFITRYHMHVIISDQRMPIMTGVELLRRSREISPRSVRILLTGYSDLAAIVGSINEGEVYRFLSKPWDNQALQTLVSEAATIALELADTKSATVTLPEKMQAGVLVIDKDEEVFAVVRELIGGRCPVQYATNTETALGMLQKNEIALVIADVESTQEQLASMLKLLKQEYPKILSIVTTKARDAELMIELINQAQVFRILNKPLNVGILKEHVFAALNRYLTFVQTPQLLQEHKVEAPAQIRTSSFAINILKRLGFLGGH